MADLKISQLSAVTALAGTEVVPVVQSGATKKATINQILKPAAGNGIDYSANTPAAGMTSQLLNWYEEGTWTPSVGGGATYDIQSGSYVRIGKSVTVHFDIQINNISAGSLTTISGLPFTVGPRSAAGSVGYFIGLSTNVVSLLIRADGATNDIIFTALTAAATGVGGTTNVLTSGTRVIGSLTYSV